MSLEVSGSRSPGKQAVEEQVYLGESDDGQEAPKLVELERRPTPVKQVAINGDVAREPILRIRKRSANAMSQRVPVQEVVRELTDPNHGKYPTGVTPKQLLAYILTMPEQQRPAIRKNWLQVTFFYLK